MSLCVSSDFTGYVDLIDTIKNEGRDMKKMLVISTIILMAYGIYAEVPSTLNYQGYLEDASDNPVTGSVNIAVALYTNASGGSAVYNENIGSVALDRGIYSFNWGANGTSIVTVTELLGMGNGASTVYNYTVENPPIIDPSVTMSDGTYSWNDVTGSSSPGNFLGTVSSYSTGTVSAIYLSGAPSSGTVINVEYDYLDASVSGALNGSGSIWMEIKIDSSPLSPRQYISSIPYALVARTLEGGEVGVDSASGALIIGEGGIIFPGGFLQSNAYLQTTSMIISVVDGKKTTPITQIYNEVYDASAQLSLPQKAIVTSLGCTVYDDCDYNGAGRISVSLERISPAGTTDTIGQVGTTFDFVGGYTNLYTDIITNGIIDNAVFSYVLRIVMDAEAGGSSGCHSLGDRLEVYPTTIHYTLP